MDRCGRIDWKGAHLVAHVRLGIEDGVCGYCSDHGFELVAYAEPWGPSDQWGEPTYNLECDVRKMLKEKHDGRCDEPKQRMTAAG